MNRLLPDSGVSLACAGVVWCGIGPCNYSRGVCSLKTKQVSLTSSVARLLLGLTAVLVVSSPVQAQQYVYYPPACNQPGCYNVQPATEYDQASDAPWYYQYSYAPQYYQPASAPQYYQAPQDNQAAEPTQTTATGTPVVPASYTVPVADPPSQPAQAAPEPTYGDPYGFLYWLNSTRASYGLGPVNYDQNLSNWAAMNNSEQMARGLGHFVMGPARHQNSAAGGGFPGAMWLASPVHRAALLDPTISWIGIAAAGAYWTFNAN
jgi:uncharacterized protein YkwD